MKDTTLETLAPRKRPRQQRSEATVAVLVEAAAQVLESDGLEGYNTNSVAQRAGVSIGSLYQYFPTKDALTIALMRREDQRFFEEGSMSLQEPDGHRALRRYIDAAVRQQLARPRLARLLDIEESRPDFQGALKVTESFRSQLEQVLRRDDIPRQHRPAMAAADIGALIRGLTDSAGERGETSLAALRRRIEAAVFGYLERMAVASRSSNASRATTAKRPRTPRA